MSSSSASSPPNNKMNHSDKIKGLLSQPTMSRLVDYFVVVGFTTDPKKGGTGCGVTLQRFPSKDWKDSPYNSAIELFCQPQGWSLSAVRQEPKFFISVLTDVDASRRYCACLSFHEPISISPSKPADEEEENEGGTDTIVCSNYGSPNSRSSSVYHTMYAPKVLVMMSHHYQPEAFRHCLGTIYTVHSESLGIPLETLIGNLLGHIQLPQSGGPQMRFTIGGGDRQTLQPPLSSTIPVTNSCVAQLFQQLGINNIIVLFCAVMTEQKILFHSKSRTRLTDSCHALTSLMFPFRYCHVYIPMLPTSITEVASSPTPYIIGILSEARYTLPEMVDVILVDLDGGSIMVPEGISIPVLPESVGQNVQEQLSMILHPELTSADFAFPPLVVKSSTPIQLDKEIRAIFMRMLAQLFQGYRSCLVMIRIHPKPFITFHKAKFLGERGLTECEFVVRLLNCMFFNEFIADRGAPYRPNDLWDDLYSSLLEQLKSEFLDPKMAMIYILELATLLTQNENPNSQTYAPKVIKPPEGAHTRTHVPIFPMLNDAIIQDIIDEGMAKQVLNRYTSSILKSKQPRIVPMGPKISEVLVQERQLVDNSARRLEVLRNCINYIFENKISDARKSIHAVIRALKSHTAKLVLCQELGQHVSGNKAMLETPQFDMVVKLMHYALQGNSVMDEHGIAAALLPLATSFCRKLCTGVIQFAYTCIQDHPVWKSQQFWETAFYSDVQKDIKSLYTPTQGNYLYNNNYPIITSFERPKDLPAYKQTEFTALEIAAEQMRLAPSLDPEKLKELINSEESTLYSQAIHYAYRMVYMLVPLDTPTKRHRENSHHHHHHHHHHDDERSSNVVSVTESDSLGGESGFEEQDPLIGDTGTSVVRFVSRFVDKVCTEGGVTEDHIRSLHSMIPGVVDMHVETLEAVFRESKRLPAVQKPKIPTPPLLPGEELVMDSLRVYLLPDGRDNNTGAISGRVLLPAEGALFFTNYRLIFKGNPCDPLVCEHSVIRSFPLASLTKDKRISIQYLAHLDQLLQEGLQLRSATFQLMKLAFDEEVTAENMEILRKLLSKLRHPTDIFSYFAFAGHSVVAPIPLNSNKDKHTTLKGFAKKTLLMTAKKAGLKPKPSKRQKYVLRNWTQGNGGTLPANTKYLNNPTPKSPTKDGLDGDEISIGSMGSNISEEQYVSDEDMPHIPVGTLITNQSTDAKSMERIMERAYYKDYKRLNLNSPNRPGTNLSAASILSKIDSFRISNVNMTYTICRSYPALLVVPALISDETLKRVSKCYRGGRFPVVTWRHPRTKALIVRGASFNSKGVMGILRGQTAAGGGGNDPGTHLEQEHFLRAIVNSTPLAVLRPDSAWAMNESNLSIDSLLTTSSGTTSGVHTETHNVLTIQSTPDAGRRPSSNPFMKAMDTLRYAGASGGKGIKTYRNWTTGRPKKPIPIPPQTAYKGAPTTTESEKTSAEGLTRLPKAALYIFGEKSQIKGIKTDTNSKIEYIPVDATEVRYTRTSFKKLMRACIPSSTVADSEKSFFNTVESTEWLQQLSNLMQLSGAVVNLVDVQGSSVMLCLEDGSDVTTQITSIAQICLDPYYRTIDGFHTLLEKEWLGFGHRFSHRNCMTGIEGPSSNPGFAPLFIQFLDIVHQVHKQFPLAFEFNQYYLQFLAYHSVSARFRTFLVDNECERVELGFMAIDDKRGSLPRHYKGVDTGSDDESIYMTNKVNSNSHHHHLGQSLFEYIEKVHAKIPIFFNFSYDKNCEIKILRPMHTLANLELWEFYICETLRSGASYDLEVIPNELQLDEEQSSEIKKDPRSSVSQGYDIIENQIPDFFKNTLSEINKLETEMGLLPQKWKQIYDKLDADSSHNESSLTRQTSISTQMVRSLGRSLHKRSTIDILIRGKMGRSTDLNSMYAHNHRFEKHTFTTLANCDSCSAMLLGKTGVRCTECTAKCHDRCAEVISKCPGKLSNTPAESVQSSNTPMSTTSSPSVSTPKSVPSALAIQATTTNYYDQFHSNIAENRTHEGYLYKRGALLKGWKQRWFVLDSIKHQLRYYDSIEDSHSKGFIDLSEVTHITLSSPTPGSPKKADDKSFFDIRTIRRSYNFCANDSALAQEWIEKIQACL